MKRGDPADLIEVGVIMVSFMIFGLSLVAALAYWMARFFAWGVRRVFR